jgi:hypothetical protein
MGLSPLIVLILVARIINEKKVPACDPNGYTAYT